MMAVLDEYGFFYRHLRVWLNHSQIHVVARTPEALQRVKYLAAQVTSDVRIASSRRGRCAEMDA